MKFTGFGILALMLLGACNVVQQPANPPNIVFILADDLGWSDLPVYGNKFNEAPHISKLAEEGMRFDNAYAACPVCSPTRASIQSGQYPARVGITDFIRGHWRPFEEVIVPINRTQYLPLENITFAEKLKEAGYSTAYYGKWHLGHNEYTPVNQGYDEQVVYNGGGFFKYGENMDPPRDFPDDKVLSEALTDLGISFIERNRDKPFLLFLAHYDVHVQLDAQQELIDKYLAKEKAEGYTCNAVYAAMIENVDNSVKLYIYEGDTMQYIATSNAPLRREKGTVYEGGIREPLIVKWPGKVKEGRLNHSVISSVDLYPTFLELAGIEPDPSQVLDGVSFLDIISTDKEDYERPIFWHYPVYHHDVPASAVRKGDFKLIENLVDGSLELYDLSKDISESVNLAESMPGKVKELYDILKAWQKDVGAEFPVPNPEFDPARRYEWGRHPSITNSNL